MQKNSAIHLDTRSRAYPVLNITHIASIILFPAAWLYFGKMYAEYDNRGVDLINITLSVLVSAAIYLTSIITLVVDRKRQRMKLRYILLLLAMGFVFLGHIPLGIYAWYTMRGDELMVCIWFYVLSIGASAFFGTVMTLLRWITADPYSIDLR